MVGTMGVALSVCTLPGRVTPDRVGPGKMELGLGIVSYSQRVTWSINPKVMRLFSNHVKTSVCFWFAYHKH